jgi:hypothetical protein
MPQRCDPAVSLSSRFTPGVQSRTHCVIGCVVSRDIVSVISNRRTPVPEYSVVELVA